MNMTVSKSLKRPFTMLEVLAVMIIMGILMAFVARVTRVDSVQNTTSVIASQLRLARAHAAEKRKEVKVVIDQTARTIDIVYNADDTVVPGSKKTYFIKGSEVDNSYSIVFRNDGSLKGTNTTIRISAKGNSDNYFDIEINQFTGKIKVLQE